jgi:RND family efflux transporter MFP subunit
VRLLAPISGLVSVVNVAPGQPVEPSTALVEIINLHDVHAVAAVPEHLVGKLQVGEKAHIRVAALPGRTFEATLAHVGAEADTAANTLEAAFHMENPDGLLRPGMRAEFSIVLSKREGVMSVPRAALQGDAASRYVYVADYELPHAFVRTPVVVGAINDRFAEITEGLFAGDKVVTRGAYSLAFAGKGSVSLKEALDAAHGHEHNEDGSEVTAEQKAARGSGGGHDHEGHGFSMLTAFFAATTGLLFVLLLTMRRKPRPESA